MLSSFAMGVIAGAALIVAWDRGWLADLLGDQLRPSDTTDTVEAPV